MENAKALESSSMKSGTTTCTAEPATRPARPAPATDKVMAELAEATIRVARRQAKEAFIDIQMDLWEIRQCRKN